MQLNHAANHQTEPEKVKGAMEYVERLYAAFNHNFFSANQWTYVPSWNPKDLDSWNAENVSIVDDKGTLRNFRPRPAAERNGGTPTAMQEKVSKDQATRKFVLEWENKPAAGETTVFVPRGVDKDAQYPAPKITAELASMRCSFSKEKQQVSCTSDATGKHTLTIE
jgi:hypothetical protein